MPEIATQTGEFIVLSSEDIKKMKPIDRKQYKIELREYKKQIARNKYNEYMRNYMKTYAKMKYKYDPVYREKRKICSSEYKQRERDKNKPVEKLEYSSSLFANNFLNTKI